MLYEIDEVFTVDLDTSDPDVNLHPGSASITILDDDTGTITQLTHAQCLIMHLQVLVHSLPLTWLTCIAEFTANLLSLLLVFTYVKNYVHSLL